MKRLFLASTVLAGLTAGDTVVTKAGSFVRAGDRVNPIAETTTN